MDFLKNILKENEDWLIDRILMYAIQTGHAKYTSTLRAAWRASIMGLSNSIIEAEKEHEFVPLLEPHFDFKESSVARFGFEQAQDHRKRGITLTMYLSLFKYYRQTYLDLIGIKDFSSEENLYLVTYLNRIFDIIEISFCEEWAAIDNQKHLNELSQQNRVSMNEKNKYLTIFDSLPSPVFLVKTTGEIDNMNLMASIYFNTESQQNDLYYKMPSNQLESEPVTARTIENTIPWLGAVVSDFFAKGPPAEAIYKKTKIYNKEFKFLVRLSPLSDVSKKSEGVVVILEDHSKIEAIKEEMNQLKGLIPICSHCKSIKNEQGVWTELEQYLKKKSDTSFSHGICEKCSESIYNDKTIEKTFFKNR